MSIMNSIVLVLCLVITQTYGLDELRQDTVTVLSESANLTDFIDQVTTTELPVDLIETTYQPLLIPIPTTNPKFNSENIDNNVNDEKSEKFPPNIYTETIFLPVAPKNYRPDLTHESLSRSNKFNLLDFTSYIHPPVLPDLTKDSPDLPKAEKLVDSKLNIDPSDYKRQLKKSKKAGKSKKKYDENEDHSNYPKPYTEDDENYYPNHFYEYFKNDFYRNHRDRYDIDAENPQRIRAKYYHPGGGTCPGGFGHQNYVQQPPLYYNYALQPVKFNGESKGRGDADDEEEEEDDEDEEDGDEEEEEEHQHTNSKDKAESPKEKTSEKQEEQKDEKEEYDDSDYNDEEEVEGDEAAEEKRQNLKFRDTEEEERFHLDREKIRDDREKFRNDNEKFKSNHPDDEGDDSEEDYEANDEDDAPKKPAKALKKGNSDHEDDEEEYEDEEEESAEKSRKTKPVAEEEVVESTTTILPPTPQRVATLKIAPRPPLNHITTTYFPPIAARDATYATESPTDHYTTVAGFRRRMNIVQEKLKRLNLLPPSTTPLIDISTFYPTSNPIHRPRRPNHRYSQLTTQQPFIIHTNEDVSAEQVVNPKAQYENIAEDAQEQKTETQSYTIKPRKYRLPPGHNRNHHGVPSNEQYTNYDVQNNRNLNKIAPLVTPPENGAQYTQNLYFAPREQSVQVPTNPNPYNQPNKLVYTHPTQIQRPQVFPLTVENPNSSPNLIQYPAQRRPIQSQLRNKNENYVTTQPVNYETYTQYKRKRDVEPDSSSTDIKYSSIYRVINENTTNPNEFDVAASNHAPVDISSDGQRTVEETDSKLDENKRTTVGPDIKKTENNDGNEAAKETETKQPPSRQDNGRKILNQAKYFQDFFAAQLRPDLLEFGHLCEDPSDWEERFERKDMKDERHQGKVRWGDKKGGYGEHYWDLNHHKPNIEDGATSSVDSVKNINSDNNNNKTSKIQSAANDHERNYDHDGVEQDDGE